MYFKLTLRVITISQLTAFLFFFAFQNVSLKHLRFCPSTVRAVNCARRCHARAAFFVTFPITLRKDCLNLNRLWIISSVTQIKGQRRVGLVS